jgi:restriction modification system DNA specificity domain protein
LDKFTQLEAELEAELDCRKRQYEYYRNNLLFYEGNEVEWKTLDQISENLDSKRQPITSGLRTSGKIPYYGASGIVDYVEDYIFDGDFLLISEDGANLLARNTPIAFSVSGKIWVNNHAHILKFRTYEERRFIEFYLNKTDLTPYISGAAQPKLNKKNLNSIKIPIPPLEEQQRIITILDKFDTLVNSISEGLPKEIALRRKQYEYYREKLLSFPKE